MSDVPDAGVAARIASLDGLRAISILLVIAHHLMGTAAAPLIIGTVTSAIDAGALGVRVFFVISGFLITGILARELQRTGMARQPWLPRQDGARAMSSRELPNHGA